MSSNLFKRNYTCVNQEDRRIIHSNELLEKRIEELAEKSRCAAAGGFVSGIQARKVALADIGENASEEERLGEEAAADSEGIGGNVIKAAPPEGQPAAEEILAQANAEAERILSQAREQAEVLRSAALAQAREEEQRLFEQAKAKGYQEGLAGFEEKSARLEAEWKQKSSELEAQYQKMIDELEPQFIDTITGIYEHIFHVKLSSYRDVLTYLISSALRKIEGSQNFFIHVSKEDYPYVSMQKKQLTAGAAVSGGSLEIVEDLTLEKNQCLIETECGIFDCGLGTQLDGLKEELRLLSYEG